MVTRAATYGAGALLAGTVIMALVAMSVAQAGDEGFQKHTMPQPTWFADAALDGTHGRSLKAATASCIIRIVGTGKKYGLRSAYIKCTGRKPTFFAGRPLVNYARTNPKRFIGVSLRLPNEPNFLGPKNGEPALFLVGAGALKLTGYVRSLSLVDWASITVEQGTNVAFSKFEWTGNFGLRFPTLAVSRSKVSATGCTWTSNVCTDKRRCHTGGPYVTEGATFSVSKSAFRGNRGHLAGAMMITAGAAANVVSNSFLSNSVVNFGDFGGAIFHDYCRTNRVSTIKSNRFVKNSSQGFGGAIKIGSPDGGCKPVIASNLFQQNKAKLTGGAIFYSYCNGATPTLTKNRFVSNTASTFKGQLGYNPKTKPAKQGGGGTGRAGCGKPRNSGNSFSGVTAYCPPWYFP